MFEMLKMRSKRNVQLFTVSSFIFFGSIGPTVAAPQENAILQGLDKVTARVSTFVAPLNNPVRFGALEVTIRHCDRTPPHEAPESRAFVEIAEIFEGRDSQQVFSGWMFGSSPALSALEHPVYDIWVLECKT